MDTTWTKEDLAVLTRKAMMLALVDDTVYCENCLVIPALPCEVYCLKCEEEIINEKIEYLAACYTEQGQVDRGLY